MAGAQVSNEAATQRDGHLQIRVHVAYQRVRHTSLQGMDSITNVIVGDILQSEEFVRGERTNVTSGTRDGGEPCQVIRVGCRHDSYPLRHSAGSGTVADGYRIEQRASYDPTRSEATFVVIDAGMRGGSGSGARDFYPDSYHVRARRLTTANKFDPKGEVIEFIQDGKDSDGSVNHPNVVGKLKKETTVVWT